MQSSSVVSPVDKMAENAVNEAKQESRGVGVTPNKRLRTPSLEEENKLVKKQTPMMNGYYIPPPNQVYFHFRNNNAISGIKFYIVNIFLISNIMVGEKF